MNPSSFPDPTDLHRFPDFREQDIKILYNQSASFFMDTNLETVLIQWQARVEIWLLRVRHWEYKFGASSQDITSDYNKIQVRSQQILQVKRVASLTRKHTLLRAKVSAEPEQKHTSLHKLGWQVTGQHLCSNSYTF